MVYSKGTTALATISKVKNGVSTFNSTMGVVSAIKGVNEVITEDAKYGAEQKQLGVSGGCNRAGEVKTLFRGERSTVTPEVVFEQGFKSKGTHTNLEQHVTSNATAGNFISTTSEKGIAQQFAGKNGYLYEIETSNYIDVNSKLGDKSPFPEQKEFSIPGGINPSKIKGAWVLKKGILTGEFIPNPTFKGGK